MPAKIVDILPKVPGVFRKSANVAASSGRWLDASRVRWEGNILKPIGGSVAIGSTDLFSSPIEACLISTNISKEDIMAGFYNSYDVTKTNSMSILFVLSSIGLSLFLIDKWQADGTSLNYFPYEGGGSLSPMGTTIVCALDSPGDNSMLGSNVSALIPEINILKFISLATIMNLCLASSSIGFDNAWLTYGQFFTVNNDDSGAKERVHSYLRNNGFLIDKSRTISKEEDRQKIIASAAEAYWDTIVAQMGNEAMAEAKATQADYAEILDDKLRPYREDWDSVKASIASKVSLTTPDTVENYEEANITVNDVRFSPSFSIDSFVSNEGFLVFCGITYYGDNGSEFTKSIPEKVGYISYPKRVIWSDPDHPLSWFYPTDANLAGSIDLQSDSEIVCGNLIGQQNLLWTKTELFRLNYLGQPFVYGHERLGSGCGACSHKAVAQVGNTCYWLGHGAFYFYDGIVRELACDVSYIVFDVDQISKGEVYATTRIKHGEVWWFYGEGKYVFYNYSNNYWSIGSLDRILSIDSGTLDSPISLSKKRIYRDELEGIIPVVAGEPISSIFAQTGFEKLDNNRVWVTRVDSDSDAQISVMTRGSQLPVSFGATSDGKFYCRQNLKDVSIKLSPLDAGFAITSLKVELKPSEKK